MTPKLNCYIGKHYHIIFFMLDISFSYFLLFCFSGLSNNSDLETFDLRHTLEDSSMIPVRYIKLEPLESWGSNFNYSLWYVELHGIDDPYVISRETTKFYQVNFKIILFITLC